MVKFELDNRFLLLTKNISLLMISLKAYLYGTTLSHATSLRQAYDTNCIV